MMQSKHARLKRLRNAAKKRTALYMARCWIENDADGFTGWRWEKHGVQLRIVSAANRYGDFVITGARHYCITMQGQIELIGLDALRVYAKECGKEEESGFIDQYGTFHDRATAYGIAKAANQIFRSEGLPTSELYSEHLC